jgi:chromosome segregation ATPase
MVMWYINHLEGQINELQRGINSLRREIEQRDVSTNGIIAKNLCLVSEKTEVSNKNALLEMDIAALKVEISRVVSEKTELFSKNAHLEKEIEALKAENEAFKAKIEALEAALEALRAGGDKA